MLPTPPKPAASPSRAVRSGRHDRNAVTLAHTWSLAAERYAPPTVSITHDAPLGDHHRPLPALPNADRSCPRAFPAHSPRIPRAFPAHSPRTAIHSRTTRPVRRCRDRRRELLIVGTGTGLTCCVVRTRHTSRATKGRRTRSGRWRASGSETVTRVTCPGRRLASQAPADKSAAQQHDQHEAEGEGFEPPGQDWVPPNGFQACP
jgi:hypothetical protein